MSTISVQDIANTLKKNVTDKRLIDIGSGAEEQFGVSKTKFRDAVNILKEEGYEVFLKPVTQVGTDKKTAVKILAAPGAKYKDIYDYETHKIDKDS